MSYSISANGGDFAKLMDDFNKKFEEVVTQQPMHLKERDTVRDAVSALAAVVQVGKDHELAASVTGSITWEQGEDNSHPVRAVSVNIYISQT